MTDEATTTTTAAAATTGPVELLRIQRELAFRLAAAVDREQVVAGVLDAVVALAGIDAVGIYTATDDDNSLHLVASHGVSAGFVDRVRVWRTDMSLGRQALTGRSVAADHRRMLAEPGLKELLDEGLRCEVVVPVEVAGRIELVLALASRVLDVVPAALSEAAETIAYVAAGAVGRVAVEHMRRVCDERSREVLQMQYQLAAALVAARQVDEALGCVIDGILMAEWADAAAVFMYDSGAQQMLLAAQRGGSVAFIESVATIPLDSPEAVTVLSGTPLYTTTGDSDLSSVQRNCTAEGLRGRALIPVMRDGHVIAAIAAASWHHEECPPHIRTAFEGCALQVGAALRRLEAEEALRESEAALHRAQRIAHIGTWRWEPDSDAVWWSDEMYSIYGRDPASFEPDISFLTQFVYPEDREPDIQLLPQRAQEMVSTVFEQRLVRADGSLRRVQMQLETAIDERGALKAVLGVVHDLTERRRTEDALALRVRFERAIATIATVLLEGREGAVEHVLRELLAASDASRVYLYENFHHPHDGIVTREVAEACAPGVGRQSDAPSVRHQPWQDGVFERWRQLLSGGEAVRGLVEHFPPAERAVLEPSGVVSLLALPVTVGGEWWGFIGFDDTVVARQWLDEDVLLLRTAANMVAAYLERNRDRVRLVEHSRERAEAGYLLIARHLTDVIWTADLDLRFSYVSPAVERLLGYRDEEFLQRSLADVLGDGGAARVREVLAAELRAERAGAGESPDPNRIRVLTLPVRAHGRGMVPCEHTVTFRRDPSGRPIGLVGICRAVASSDAIADQ